LRGTARTSYTGGRIGRPAARRHPAGTVPNDTQRTLTAMNPLQIESRDYYTVLIHFYRGELGRIMIWRQRLDVTSNWAILATTGIVTFGLSSASNSHLVFAIALLICLLLLIIEGRRYRYYVAFRARVRMLEAHLIMPVLLKDVQLLQGDWNQQLAADLVEPTFKISRLEAITRRFARNYVWIFAVNTAAWYLKLWLHYPESHEAISFLKAVTADNPFPAGILLGLLTLFYGFLLFLLARAIVVGPKSGEFRRGVMRGQTWL
jgi:uncharacterized membrane protein